MKCMQFCAIVLLTLLTLKLVMQPRKVAVNPVKNKARWLMASGTALLAVQFLLQYTLGLRERGVTQAVMLNLALFIPASALFSLGVLSLQTHGRLTRMDKWIGVPTWLIVMTLIGLAASTTDSPLSDKSPQMRWAEIGASCFYAIMQAYFTARLIKKTRTIAQALGDYFDRDMDGLLRWMKYSICLLALMSLLVPALIFLSGKWIASFALFFFTAIFYMVDNFCSYVVSSAQEKVLEAEENSDEMGYNEAENHENTISDDIKERVEKAVDKWIAEGGFRHNGIKCPKAADEMQIPCYQFKAWLRQTGKKYSTWLRDLRIEEAKRVLREHPEWTNEAVAQHCGFSDRSYFQTVFKRQTGLTPNQFTEQ